MKTNLIRRIPTALTLTALMVGLTVIAHAEDQNNAPHPPKAPATAVTAEPSTPLPIPPPAEPWIDPNWKDPGQVLPEVSFDLTVSDVAIRLRHLFKDAFDVVLPNSSSWQRESFDLGSVTLKFQMKNVTATELFNAMNLMFEADNTPVRWQLKMNGNRPLALLSVVPSMVPPLVAPGNQTVQIRKAFFVGDLVGDEKFGGTTMEQLFKTVCQVYDMGYGKDQVTGESRPSELNLRFHKEAQLIIVSGSADNIDFVQDILAALRQKARMPERSAGDATTKTETPKKHEAAPAPSP
jgi:hypothetical protein